MEQKITIISFKGKYLLLDIFESECISRLNKRIISSQESQGNID